MNKSELNSTVKIKFCFAFAMLFLSFAFALPTSAQIVINEVYGGGGNAGATYNRDFVELYNRGTTNIDIAGYSLQYEAAAGAGPFEVCSITASDTVIEPNTYFLIATGAVGTNGAVLPTPNATCPSLTLSATAGKVALVSNTTALTGSCPIPGATVIDFVGYGTTASCFEGAGRAPAPSNTTSIQRTPAGTDTNNNNTDFQALAPTPQAAGTTAAAAIISGRITTTRGRAISYVKVMLSGGNLENPIYATSSAFGYYRFPEVEAGETYILQVFSRRFTFNPATRIVNLSENLTDANFVGTEDWLNNTSR